MHNQHINLFYKNENNIIIKYIIKYIHNMTLFPE